jgi:hypothetical protein
MIDNLEGIFDMALDYYTELFNEGIWTQATLESAKSSFIFWKNRCWNCRKEDCNVTICKLPIGRVPARTDIFITRHRGAR